MDKHNKYILLLKSFFLKAQKYYLTNFSSLTIAWGSSSWYHPLIFSTHDKLYSLLMEDECSWMNFIHDYVRNDDVGDDVNNGVQME